ncbi:hypothetical protein EVJ58_g9624 [Rhodofomes roseus]|uniref:BRCT domain-containing protein n=1 Tax=Rhodofomes roseus TaxID=34475 RepID=A0A4Y9XSM6_9APHY|nr:hypothetical protein EVJ58_g9624 [Rhodofomes roseus]
MAELDALSDRLVPLGLTRARHVVSAPADKAIWRPLAQAGHRVWNQELILTSALKQEIDWENETYLLTPDA